MAGGKGLSGGWQSSRYGSRGAALEVGGTAVALGGMAVVPGPITNVLGKYGILLAKKVGFRVKLAVGVLVNEL